MESHKKSWSKPPTRIYIYIYHVSYINIYHIWYIIYKYIIIYIYISIKPQVLRRSFHQLLDPKYSTGTGSVHRHSTGDGVVLHGQQQTHCGAPQFGYCWFINPMVIYLYMVIWLVIWLYMVIWLYGWLYGWFLVYVIYLLLVGGLKNILKNMKVNGKDYPIYDGKIKHVWTHQPVIRCYPVVIWFINTMNSILIR